MEKKSSKISCQGPFNNFLIRSVSYYPIMRNSVQSKIPRNSAAFRDTEFRIIPRNFRQFSMAYGIYGSNKNVRNSVLTEFRGHPIRTSATLLIKVPCSSPAILIGARPTLQTFHFFPHDFRSDGAGTCYVIKDRIQYLICMKRRRAVFTFL
jgi:hypothetical protein